MLPAQRVSSTVTMGAIIAAALGLAAAAAYLVRAFLRPKHTEALQTSLHGQGDARSLIYHMVHAVAVCDIFAALDVLLRSWKVIAPS